MSGSVSNPMSIATYMRVAEVLPREITVCLRADHGLGKSSVERQLRQTFLERDGEALMEATPKGEEVFPFIDRRLSQMSDGDMIGLPSTDGNRTRFNPPDWFKTACERPCFLFLDELNRATPEVMQAAFQIVLDRELNGHRLHPLTRVSTAINTAASYSVNEMDPALLDRFFVVDLVPDHKDWMKWAGEKCNLPDSPKFGRENITPVVREFIRTEPKWLDTPRNADLSRCHPSRRSWERVSDALVHAELEDSNGEGLFYTITMGFCGTEAAIAFQGFAANFDNRVTGEEILEKYHTKRVKEKISRQGQEALNAAIDKVSDHVIKNVKKLTKRQGTNLRDFMDDLPGELRIACWGKLTLHGIEQLELAKSIHEYCAKGMLEVFGVPMGEAGIGVVPNIPGIFQQDEKKEG